MTSIMAKTPLISLSSKTCPDNSVMTLSDLGSLQNAVEPFTKSILRSGHSSVHLHCKVPTWSQSDTCLDLHDLHELRSRLLLFIPSLLRSLRSSGVNASYSLSPSDTSLCVICAFPPDLCSSQTKQAASAVLKNTKCSKRENAVLADLEYGPALIIT